MDENRNSLPAVYNMMGATNSNEHMNSQFRRFRQAMRDDGVEPVAESAYLEKEVNLAYVNSHITILELCIMPWLRELAASSSAEDYSIVFVWDLDDIAMLSRSHMKEISFLRPNVESMSLYRLVDSVLMSVDIAHPDEVEAGKVANISDVFFDEGHYYGTTAPKLYALKRLYDELSNETKMTKNKKSILSHELIEKCGLLERADELCQIASKCQEIHNQRWKCVKKSMNLVNRRSSNPKYKKYTNVVISKEGVANAAAQLLVSGLSSAVPIENIYSTYRKSEKSVWRRVQKRFGQHCGLIYVTTPKLYHFPEEFQIEIWPVGANESIKQLYTAQKDHLLT